ncbi:MAG: bifunctional glutamine synthetase adenylyltransferase/deadenyltransferase, partial [Halieaceae bacterium]
MSINTTELPAELVSQAELAWNNVSEAADDAVIQGLEQAMEDPAYARQCARVLACSPFVADAVRRKPGLLLELLSSGALRDCLPTDAWQQELATLLAQSDLELGVVLRRFRQRHMVRIIWRDFCRLADTQETVH